MLCIGGSALSGEGLAGLHRGTDSSGPRWELERQLAVLNSQFNRRVLIDLFIWNDDQNSSRHVIYVCNTLSG